MGGPSFLCDCGCVVTPGDIPCEPDPGRCPLEAHYAATLHPFRAVAAIFDAAAARLPGGLKQNAKVQL